METTNFEFTETSSKEKIGWVLLDFFILLLSLLFALFLLNEYLTINGNALFSRPDLFNKF